MNDTTAPAAELSGNAPATDATATPAATAAPEATPAATGSAAPNPVQSAFERLTSTPAPTGNDQAGAPAQGAGPAAGAADPATPSPTAGATPDTTATGAAATAAAAGAASGTAPVNPYAGLGEGFTDEASVKAALTELGTLRENQLTDEHRQLIALASDPEKLTRYAALSTVDYKAMPDKDVLLEKFKLDNPGMPARALTREFEAAFSDKYKALAYEDPADEDFLAAKELVEFHASKATTELTALKPVVAAPAATARTAEQQASIDAHVAKVAEIVKDYKGTAFPIKDGDPFVVTPTDLPAFQEALTNPMRYILSQVMDAEGNIDYAVQQEIALALVERRNLVGYGVSHAKTLGATVPLREAANMPEGTPVQQQPADNDWQKDFVRSVNAAQRQ